MAHFIGEVQICNEAGSQIWLSNLEQKGHVVLYDQHQPAEELLIHFSKSDCGLIKDLYYATSGYLNKVDVRLKGIAFKSSSDGDPFPLFVMAVDDRLEVSDTKIKIPNEHCLLALGRALELLAHDEISLDEDKENLNRQKVNQELGKRFK